MKTPWAQARNILAVQLGSLGEVLMTSPALWAIKQSAAGVRLTLLSSHVSAPVARLLEAVDDCIPCTAPYTDHAASASRVDRALVQRLTRGRFDAAIIFTASAQSAWPAALTCRRAGIPLRLAYAREDPYGLLTDWLHDTGHLETGTRHEVLRQLELVQQVGYATADDRMHLHYAPEDAWSMRELLAAAGGRLDKPYLVVQPGAQAQARRYPAQRYGLAADALGRRTGYQIVFTGSTADAGLVTEAGASMQYPFVNLAGRLDLGQLAALIAGAQAVLCNNTGPAHMAAALGTPLVVLYALTDPPHAPWRARSQVLSHDVPCRNCQQTTCPEKHHACLERIEVPTVVDAVLAMLETPPAVPLSSMGRMQHCPWDLPLQQAAADPPGGRDAPAQIASTSPVMGRTMPVM